MLIRCDFLVLPFLANTLSRNASYWFWGTVLIFGIFNRLYEYHFISRCPQKRYGPGLNGLTKRTPFHYLLAFSELVRHWARIHLILPPAIGNYRQRLLHWCTIPTRIEAITVISFYLLSLVLTIIGYDVFRGNL